MRKSIYTISLWWLIWAMVVSCDTIHEFPDENPVDPTPVNVHLEAFLKSSDLTNDGEFPVYKPDNHTWRFVMEAYKADNKSVPVLRKEMLLGTNLTDAVAKETFQLPAIKHRIVAWIDHVPADTHTDNLYTTADGLRSIRQQEPLTGNTDMSDCFYGFKDLDLLPYRDRRGIDVTLSMEMTRPVAKYILVTNDVEEFIAHTRTQGLGLAKTTINNFTAKIYYEDYTSIGLDAYTGLLNEARTGLWYSGTFQVINDKEAIIAFSYPFTNDRPSKAILGVQIFDEEGVLVNETGEVNVPLTRGELTVIRSGFLTHSNAPGLW